MNYLILGSGFGLYGYLPAISKISKKIFIPEKYKDFFLSRNDLKKYKNKIIWFQNINNILNKIQILIIAKRPSDQEKAVKIFLNKKNKIKHFFLEKPIAINPERSLRLINILVKKKKNFSFGFIFKFLEWYKFLQENITKSNLNFEIHWNIKKNNNQTWKRFHKFGGGVLRFYGIHFIKLFSDLGFTNLNYNYFDKKKTKWIVKLNNKYNSKINLSINCRSSINRFVIKLNKKTIYNLDNPFYQKITPLEKDPRVKYLKRYIKFSINKKTQKKINYFNFIEIWKKVEKKKII